MNNFNREEENISDNETENKLNVDLEQRYSTEIINMVAESCRIFKETFLNQINCLSINPSLRSFTLQEATPFYAEKEQQKNINFNQLFKCKNFTDFYTISGLLVSEFS